MKRVVLGTLAAWIAVFVVGPLFFVAQTQAPTLPAPTVNRVAFPFGYRDTFKLFYVFDNYQNRQIRAVYANGIATSVGPGAYVLWTSTGTERGRHSRATKVRYLLRF